MLYRLLLLVLLSITLGSSCVQRSASQSERINTALPTKINGISFVAAGISVDQEHIDPVVEVNANYAAIMPFGFLRDSKSPEVFFNTDRQWFGEKREGVAQYIQMLQKNNIQVMLKPQLWIRRGEFTGYLKMTSEADWNILETSYRNFILEFAEVASELNVPLFCIGTELEQFIVNRPDFWNQLISEIKTIYSGKLTYAANWDEYKRVHFWEELDYIGVDAYFPISDSKTPTIEEARLGWIPWKEELKSISQREDRKILFTEFGYRSVDFTGKEPWKSERYETPANLEAQLHATQGTFDALWQEEWFAGGFIWKWFVNHDRVGGLENNMFTPQNKPAEAVIKQHYHTYR